MPWKDAAPAGHLNNGRRMIFEKESEITNDRYWTITERRVWRRLMKPEQEEHRIIYTRVRHGYIGIIYRCPSPSCAITHCGLTLKSAAPSFRRRSTCFCEFTYASGTRVTTSSLLAEEPHCRSGKPIVYKRCTYTPYHYVMHGACRLQNCDMALRDQTRVILHTLPVAYDARLVAPMTTRIGGQTLNSMNYRHFKRQH